MGRARHRPGTVALVLAAVLLVGAGPPGGSAASSIGRRTVLLGWSVDRRPIRATEVGNFSSPVTALVVGCIHGTECAGTAVALRLIGMAPHRGADLWVLPNLNPDGYALGTRGNAHGVDLNRNFAWRWKTLTGVFDSGPAPLSEPETRIAEELVERVRPTVSIWFHQQRDVVDDSSGNIGVEQAFAAAAGMRTARLAREPGSAVTWETHCYPSGTAFVVELPAGQLGPVEANRLARAVYAAVKAAPRVWPAPAAGCASGT